MPLSSADAAAPSFSPAQLQDWQHQICAIADEAGCLILEHYHNGTETMIKGDGSPVTLADQAAETMITRALEALSPDIPVIGEEASAAQTGTTDPGDPGDIFWLVDPLDGTKEFLRRNGEFTVNIALIAAKTPILGVVFAPALQECYSGGLSIGARMRINGPRWQPMTCQPPDLSQGVRLTASRSHSTPDAPLPLRHDLRVLASISRGSSLKFCDLASGRADLYPRTGPTCEWDTAAGQAVLVAAGGCMTQWNGTPFAYGKSAVNFLNPGFLASTLPMATHISLLA